MKVSLNTIKQYIDFELPSVDELVKRINEQLGGVEEVIDLAAKYKDAVIVKVVEAEKHPNADRLNVTKIDDGGKTPGVPRDENGLVQVVCGAPNVHADMFAVWLPPKSTVPASYDDAEPFVLDARELRGVLSQGMLAAADELAIGTDHEGIIEINPDEWKPSDIEIKPGANFAASFGLNDTIIDIENKMFTHRPDLFGQIGIAREIAGILGHKFTSPNWYLDAPKFETGSGLGLEVFNDAGDKVPRVMFAAMKNIEIKPSPLWLQCALVAMGSKPINNIVDVTNYVMLLTAQPTHAYDYDKIRGHKIGARMAKSGEKITLLNDKTYELTEDDIVIADGVGPIGLGGIMGGGDSEVDADTKNIILEVATFDMYAVRKSAMRHGVFTDALTRFNKGQSPFQNDHVMNLLMTSVQDVSAAEQASEVHTIGSYNDDCEYVENGEPRSANYSSWSQGITEKFINDRLGLMLEKHEIAELLVNVEFKIDTDEQGLDVYIPFWRTDIELPEDIVEEVGRLYGFDKLPRELPTRSIKPAAANPQLAAKRALRQNLSRAGANEVLTYSFVHENILKRAGQNPEKAYRLGNALSPDLQYYRLSLTPSLFDKIHMNIRAGYDEFALYEIGKGHHKDAVDGDGLPKEFDRVAGVYANKKPSKKSGAAYYKSQKLVKNLLEEFGLGPVSFTKVSQYELPDFDPFKQMLAPYDTERSAIVTCGEKLIGVVGEFTPSVAKNFKLPDYASGFELFVSPFVVPVNYDYQPLSKFPSVTQDISLRVATDVAYQSVVDVCEKTLTDAKPADTTVSVAPLDIYQADNDTVQKTITLRVTVTNYEKTLRDSDVTPLLDGMAEVAARELSAARI